MINIRTASDLKNRYPEIEEKSYNEYIEKALDEADKQAEDPHTRYYTHEEIFGKLRRTIDE